MAKDANAPGQLVRSPRSSACAATLLLICLSGSLSLQPADALAASLLSRGAVRLISAGAGGVLAEAGVRTWKRSKNAPLSLRSSAAGSLTPEPPSDYFDSSSSSLDSFDQGADLSQFATVAPLGASVISSVGRGSIIDLFAAGGYRVTCAATFDNLMLSSQSSRTLCALSKGRFCGLPLIMACGALSGIASALFLSLKDSNQGFKSIHPTQIPTRSARMAQLMRKEASEYAAFFGIHHVMMMAAPSLGSRWLPFAMSGAVAGSVAWRVRDWLSGENRGYPAETDNLVTNFIYLAVLASIRLPFNAISIV